MYHGWGRRRNYFEGWYCKIVDPEERFAFAFIPGISMDADGNQHAFIQVLDGKACTAAYHEFPAPAFRPDRRRFGLDLGDNYFSAERVVLDLPEVRGELHLQNRTPWPKMLGAPGIMGWYSFVPFMECYHGIVSLHHDLEGALTVRGERVDFTGGRGYMEKDWGQSFPSSWIWVHSNHFDDPQPVSLTASVARIPWLGSHFIGYIVGFWRRRRLYRFATYTGAMMRAQLGEHTVSLAFKDRRRRLELLARQAGGGELISPIAGSMAGKVNESMQSTVSVKFFEDEQLIFEGEGRNTALEVAGPAAELLTDKWRR